MNSSELIRRIKLSKITNVSCKEIDIINDIMSFIPKLSIKNLDDVFYILGDEIYIQQDIKNKTIYLRYLNFWELFESKLELDYADIVKLTSYLLEAPLKTRGWKITQKINYTVFQLESPIENMYIKH